MQRDHAARQDKVFTKFGLRSQKLSQQFAPAARDENLRWLLERLGESVGQFARCAHAAPKQTTANRLLGGSPSRRRRLAVFPQLNQRQKICRFVQGARRQSRAGRNGASQKNATGADEVDRKRRAGVDHDGGPIGFSYVIRGHGRCESVHADGVWPLNVDLDRQILRLKRAPKRAALVSLEPLDQLRFNAPLDADQAPIRVDAAEPRSK